MSDVDTNVVDVHTAVYKVNETTNTLNLTFKFKIDVPEDLRVSDQNQ